MNAKNGAKVSCISTDPKGKTVSSEWKSLTGRFVLASYGLF